MKIIKEKYGLPTATALVVGVVIGSGVFYKADDVLTNTNGNLILSLLSWMLGAMAMIFGTLVFSHFAQRYQKTNGIVDYYEEAFGDRAGYLIGWYKTIGYYPVLCAVLSWLVGMYVQITLGTEDAAVATGTWVIGFFALILFYFINYYAPLLSGKIQISTTIIKLIPLITIGIGGIILGLKGGVAQSNFSIAASNFSADLSTLPKSVVATAFAYEGWIVALTINSEIKNSKKNLPRALIFGSFLIFILYLLYFLGVSSSYPVERILLEGDAAVASVANLIFGNFGSKLLTVIIVISVIGTLNGLVISCIRAPYSLGVRGQGPFADAIGKLDSKTEMPRNSMFVSLGLSLFYYVLWYGSFAGWYGQFVALDEIPIVTIYFCYVLLYLWSMKNFTDLNAWRRFGQPIIATIGAAIILYGGFTSPSLGLYLLISVVIFFIGNLFYRKEVSHDGEDERAI